MKIDIYHLYRHWDYAVFGYPIIIEVLKLWSRDAGWDARVAVAKEHEVDLDTGADVVAFSIYTQTAPAAYRLARKLRAKGKTVVFGGPHFRGPNYTEGLPHCDILAVSICRRQWLQTLKDIETGSIRPRNPECGENARLIEDKEHRFRYPENFHESFKNMKFFHLASIPTALGCPYHCDFCNPYMQGQYLVRDVETIYNEFVRAPRWRPLFLADAATGLNKGHTIQLMKRVAPLKRDILLESTLKRLQDPELLDAFAEGGVKWLTVGLEGFNIKMGKLGAGSLDDNIQRLLDNAHNRGMLVEGNFIIGLDSDGPEVFDNIYEFYERSTLDIIIIDLLTPYPNTALFYDMQRQGRIIDTDWEHYDYHHVVYQPKQMTPERLIDGFTKLYRDLYSTKMMLRNIKSAFTRGTPGNQSICTSLFNFWQRYDAGRKEKALQRNKQTLPPAALRGLSEGQGAAPPGPPTRRSMKQYG